MRSDPTYAISPTYVNLKSHSRVMPSSIQQILFRILLCLNLSILSGQPKWSTLFLKTWHKKVGFGKVLLFRKEKLEEKREKKSRRDIPGQTWKFRDFFHRLNPGIFYPGIFQESKSRDFLVPGFFDPGISRDIPGPGYPVDIPSLEVVYYNRYVVATLV